MRECQVTLTLTTARSNVKLRSFQAYNEISSVKVPWTPTLAGDTGDKEVFFIFSWSRFNSIKCDQYFQLRLVVVRWVVCGLSRKGNCEILIDLLNYMLCNNNSLLTVHCNATQTVTNITYKHSTSLPNQFANPIKASLKISYRKKTVFTQLKADP